jgi:hypothetical protein
MHDGCNDLIDESDDDEDFNDEDSEDEDDSDDKNYREKFADSIQSICFAL